MWFDSRVGCTNGVSDDENWVLELREVEWGKLFDGTDRPSV